MLRARIRSKSFILPRTSDSQNNKVLLQRSGRSGWNSPLGGKPVHFEPLLTQHELCLDMRFSRMSKWEREILTYVRIQTKHN
jgi:hypothetical protein